VGRCTPGCATRLVPPTPVARRRGDEPRHSGPGPPEPTLTLQNPIRPNVARNFKAESNRPAPASRYQLIDQLSITRARVYAGVYRSSRYILRSDNQTPGLVTSSRERTRPQTGRYIGLSYRSQCLPPRNAPYERYFTPQPDLRSGLRCYSRIARLIPEGP
jgi:hypothetical protein